ncbi:MAG: efflux RND transporter periplasmic adaptor subunit [Marinobacter sp.]|nr:efflux RND transporter periplasmic adaptor subunit [Marinobacter sp.]
MVKQGLIGLIIVIIAAIGAGIVLFGDDDAGSSQAPQSRPANVNVVSPRLERVTDTIEAVGTLRSREEIEITSEVDGRIMALNFRQGQRVDKGQLLVQLDDRQAQADLQVAEARLADARTRYDRALRLRQNNSVPQSQVDELRTEVDVAQAQRLAARTRLDNHRIEAPFAGVVGLRAFSVGAYVRIGAVITTLDATDEMELSFSVPERFLGAIRQGQTVQGITAAFPDEVFSGTLTDLGSRINPLNRSLPVQALVQNSDNRLRPGQFMSVSLTLREREALVIPEQAVLTQGTTNYVYVNQESSAQRVEVQLGVRMPGVVEISNGLAHGDQVVITGQDRLRSGQRLNVLEDDNALIGGRWHTGQEG